MRFDLETMGSDELPQTARYDNPAVQDGRIDGLCIYFNAVFDDAIVIETSPVGQLTSWTMMMYRVPGFEVREGQRIEYDLDIQDILDDSTWRLAWRTPVAAA